MRKSLLFISFLCVGLIASAQQAVKITFEDAEIGSTGGATAMWDVGTVAVVANTYTTGNTSAKVLHVNNTNYLPIYFGNVAIPAGAQTMYSKIRAKYLIIGGTDTNYPALEIFSSPNSTTAGATEKIGEIPWAGLWGNAEIGVWKTVEFAFANATLVPVPAGNLVLKLSKSNTEYLVDDVELVPVPAASNIITLADFESNAIDDVLNMRRWSTTDASATVKANPTDPTNKSVQILATNWNSCLKLNVVLPTGKVLADYDKLTFGIYLNNLEGTDNTWKNVEVYVDGTKVIDVQSQGVANAWENKEYALNNLAGANAFVLDLGLNTNKANYYLDNIKINQKITGNNNPTVNPLFIYTTDNAFVLNQTVDSYELYSIQGSRVANGQNASSINTSNLRKGIYILKAVVDGEIFKVKISK